MEFKNENLKIVVFINKVWEPYLSMGKICTVKETEVHIFVHIQKFGCLRVNVL